MAKFVLFILILTVAWIHCGSGKKLRKQEKPVFNQKVESLVFAVEGSEAKLRCKVQGSPKPFLLWYRNGKMMKRNKRYHIERYSLVINNVSQSDSGKYSCYAYNAHGEIWGNFTLDITGTHDYEDYNAADIKPRIPDVPGAPVFTLTRPMRKLVVVPAASFIKLKCPAAGNPKPNITWWKDNAPFVKRSFGTLRIKKWQLQLTDVIPDDNGNYTCVVQNEKGRIQHTFTVEVVPRLPAPPILEGPRNQTVFVGDVALFECHVTSDPQPHLQWVKHYQVNGSYKTEDGKPYIKVLQLRGQSSMNNTSPESLVIENVTLDDAGWYTCLATNYIGVSYKSAWLTVNPVPDQRWCCINDKLIQET